MAQDKTEKIHHCFYCGVETKDYDELPNGHRIYVCDDYLCNREVSEIVKEIEADARQRAEEDDFSRYY